MTGGLLLRSVNRPLDSDIWTWNLDNLHNFQQLLLEFDNSDLTQYGPRS